MNHKKSAIFLVLIFLTFFALNSFAVVYTVCPTDNNVITEDTNFVGLTECAVADDGNVGIFQISTDNVTLDCGGMTIEGDNSGTGIYIYSSADNVTIKNCAVREYAQNLYAYTATNTNIIDSNFSGATAYNLFLRSGSNNLTDVNIVGTGQYSGSSVEGIRILSSNVTIDSSSFKGFDGHGYNNATGAGEAIFNNSGQSLTITNSSFTDCNNAIEVLMSSNMSITNTDFYNVFDSIIIHPNSAGITFSDNNITGTGAIGSKCNVGVNYLYTSSGTGPTIHNNFIEGCNEGIRVGVNLISNWFSINNNTLFNDYNGIYVINSALNTTVYSSIANNTITGLTGDFAIKLFTADSASDYLLVYDNTISENDANAIVISGGLSDVNIYNNDIKNNTGSNNSGFYFTSTDTGTNLIFDNNVSGNDFGIVADSSSNSNLIFNNYFSNSTNVLSFSSSGHDWNKTRDCSSTNIIGGLCKGGNYWSDYSGYDVTSDGIGDTSIPYVILSAGDYLPLTNEDDSFILTISSPSDGASISGTSVLFKYSANYPSEVKNYWVSEDNGVTWINNGTDLNYSFTASENGRPFSKKYSVKATMLSDDSNSSIAEVNVTFVGDSTPVCSFVLNDGDCCTTAGENSITSPNDCGGCIQAEGDGICCTIVGEDPTNSPLDCEECGDGLCTGSETVFSCPSDCGEPLPDLFINGANATLNANRDAIRYFTAEIANIGLVDSDYGISGDSGFYVSVYKNEINDESLVASKYVEFLDANESKMIFIGVSELPPKLPVIGNIVARTQNAMPDEFLVLNFADITETYYIFIDSSNNISESNEKNNTSAFAVTIDDGEIVIIEPIIPEIPGGGGVSGGSGGTTLKVDYYKELFLGARQSIRVYTSDNNPVPGAFVYVTGTIYGVTDKDGIFSFEADDEGLFDFSVFLENIKRFANKYDVKNLKIFIDSESVGIGEVQGVRVIDTLSKPVTNTEVVFDLPDGSKQILVTDSVGFIEFSSNEVGLHNVSAQIFKAYDEKQFVVITLASVTQGILNDMGILFFGDALVNPLLLLILLLLCIIAAYVTFKNSELWLGLEIVSSRVQMKKDTVRIALAVTAFVLPLLISRFTSVGIGIVFAIIEIAFVLGSVYWIQQQEEKKLEIKA